MKRHECLQAVAKAAGDTLTIVTVGGTATEWHAYRPSEGNFRCRTLGLVSSISLGLALVRPQRKVLALDGDGALLMNLCSLPTMAWRNPPNLIHVVFDNGVYEASASLPTATVGGADLVALARDTGYPHAVWAPTVEAFRQEFQAAMDRKALSFIGARVEPGLTTLPQWILPERENKYRFRRYVQQTEPPEPARPTRVAAEKGGAQDTPGVAAAREILAALQEAEIDLVASVPDEKLGDLLWLLHRQTDLIHVPLCREEEGIGVCAGAHLGGKRAAIFMQNAGFLNSCNGLTTTALQFSIPMLLLIYYAGDIGDRGFATVGSVTEPVLQAMGIRYYILREREQIRWTIKGAQVLAEESERPVAVLLTKDVLAKR
ncbi:MAG: hypothetical protein HYV08_14420 [Deltaproteobacteria bacterium]|nr:hypothetical protein [Deltaproteobacteria bacterium]